MIVLPLTRATDMVLNVKKGMGREDRDNISLGIMSR